jgi:hypothetical protein
MGGGEAPSELNLIEPQAMLYTSGKLRDHSTINANLPHNGTPSPTADTNLIDRELSHHEPVQDLAPALPDQHPVSV